MAMTTVPMKIQMLITAPFSFEHGSMGSRLDRGLRPFGRGILLIREPRRLELEASARHHERQAPRVARHRHPVDEVRPPAQGRRGVLEAVQVARSDFGPVSGRRVHWRDQDARRATNPRHDTAHGLVCRRLSGSGAEVAHRPGVPWVAWRGRGWCNGSTRSFGVLCRGSNPRPRATTAQLQPAPTDRDSP